MIMFGKWKSNVHWVNIVDIEDNVNSKKSTCEYLITLEGYISWQSQLKCISFNTTKAENITITVGCKEIIWMKMFLLELDQNKKKDMFPIAIVRAQFTSTRV